MVGIPRGVHREREGQRGAFYQHSLGKRDNEARSISIFGRERGNNEARSMLILWEREGIMRRREPSYLPVYARYTHPAIHASLLPFVGRPALSLADVPARPLGAH